MTELTDDDLADLALWADRSVEQVRAEIDDAPPGMAHWVARDGALVIGAIHPWRSPDGRLRVYHDGIRRDAVGPLLAVVADECVTEVDAADQELLAALERCGFDAIRHERLMEVPVAPLEAPLPADVTILPADRADPEALMSLDVALRNDTPGAEGWQADLEWFISETYLSPYFDPETYPVAVGDDGYVGLARVWSGPVPNRLGHVGVRRAHRRRGLALALIAAIISVLDARGVAAVTAEVDETNVASLALFSRLRATVTGGRVELVRLAR